MFLKLSLLTRKAYIGAKNSISAWTNQLLDNHMTHIQKAAEDAAASIRDVAQSNREVALTMKEMRADFQANNTEIRQAQTDILTGIEVIKAKVD